MADEMYNGVPTMKSSLVFPQRVKQCESVFHHYNKMPEAV